MGESAAAIIDSRLTTQERMRSRLSRDDVGSAELETKKLSVVSSKKKSCAVSLFRFYDN